MLKQNKIKLYNASPFYYANYRGINYGMASDTEMVVQKGPIANANTIEATDAKGTIYSYAWKNASGSREWTCMPIEIYLYSPDNELSPEYDYFHFRGMLSNGIIASQYASQCKIEISQDKHYGKITFHNYYGVCGIWASFPEGCTVIIYNKLCHINPDKWMRGYFETLNTLTSTQTLSLGPGWLNKLSTETKKIATDKGWTLA